MIISKLRKFLYFSLICASFFVFINVTRADTIGQMQDFYVEKEFDKYSRLNVLATLRHIGAKSYFYVEDPYWNKLSSSDQNSLLNNIKDIAAEFDVNIYPKETQLWGSEPNPGVDGDPRITFLVEELSKSTAGYFNSANIYKREDVSNSNQREMMSINGEVALLDKNFAKNFITHEFQHLISANQKDLLRDSFEDVWLNEVRSEYSISHVGYNDIFSGSSLERRLGTFLENPSDSLVEWPNKTVDYGIANIFGEYLVEQYGDSIFSKTLKGSSVGIDSINLYLQQNSKSERFNDIFVNWMAAVYLNDISKDGRLGYRRAELKKIKVPSQQKAYLSDSSASYNAFHNIKDWQPYWLEFSLGALAGDSSKSLKVEFWADVLEKFQVGYLAYYNSGDIEFNKAHIINGRGNIYVANSSKGLNKVVILATKSTKNSNFSSLEPEGILSVKASIVETKEVEANILKDGALIKRPREKEIYVIWGKYKRYLNPEAISLYGHLNPATAIELEPEAFNSYQTSNYVKYVNDERVYAVWPDGTKHWLNITPQQWEASSRDWNAIFTINDLELNYYKTGADITR